MLSLTPVSQLRHLFGQVPTADISDCMDRLCGTSGLHKYHRSGTLVGTAFTVKTRPGDNLIIHKALTLANEGDVLVIDGGGDAHRALVGEFMLRQAQVRRLAGFVVGGAIRDVAAFRAEDFPCYAVAHTPLGPYKSGPGYLRVPVTVGGLVIHHGDIIVGDEDGVVAFPPSEMETLAEKCRIFAAQATAKMSAIREGRHDTSWIDEKLRS